MRKIGIIIGSESDLKQCIKGLEYLIGQNKAEVIFVKVISVHRNTKDLLAELERLAATPDDEKINALIAGAGWANHLSGTTDAYLRYTLRDSKIQVYAVAFSDEQNSTHTEAARLSITEVPKSNMIFDDYVGEVGFYHACYDAVNSEPKLIELPPLKPVLEFTLSEALDRCCKLIYGTEEKK
jgi:phosphoribosylcarboxyaminoimidazole (NCAIR) mutase